jgi:gluconolactonase
MKPRAFASDLRFPEGPTVDSDGLLCIVEIAAGAVRRFRPDGTCASTTYVGGGPNGLARAADGVLFVCNNGGRWVASPSTGYSAGPGELPGLVQCLDPDNVVRPVLGSIDGVPLSSPNDICIDANGDLWFTDPAWRDESGEVGPGAVCFATRDGDAARVITDLIFPNGIGISPDGTTLVICESGKGRVVAYPILGPGRLGERRTWAYLGRGTVPDGLCFDASGRLLVAAHATSRVFVFAPGGEELEQTIELGDAGVTNVCFWGPEGKTLCITESDQGRVSAIDWDVAGLPLPSHAGV